MSRSVALTQDSTRLRSKSIYQYLIHKTRGKNLLSNNYESKPSYNYTRILSVWFLFTFTANLTVI